MRVASELAAVWYPARTFVARPHRCSNSDRGRPITRLRCNANVQHAQLVHQLERRRVDDSFVAFGCGAPEQVLLIPFDSFRPWLEDMHKTQQEDGRFYWHVHVRREKGAKFFLQRRKGAYRPEITGFLLADGGTDRDASKP